MVAVPVMWPFPFQLISITQQRTTTPSGATHQERQEWNRTELLLTFQNATGFWSLGSCTNIQWHSWMSKLCYTSIGCPVVLVSCARFRWLVKLIVGRSSNRRRFTGKVKTRLIRVQLSGCPPNYSPSSNSVVVFTLGGFRVERQACGTPLKARVATNAQPVQLAVVAQWYGTVGYCLAQGWWAILNKIHNYRLNVSLTMLLAIGHIVGPVTSVNLFVEEQ